MPDATQSAQFVHSISNPLPKIATSREQSIQRALRAGTAARDYLNLAIVILYQQLLYACLTRDITIPNNLTILHDTTSKLRNQKVTKSMSQPPYPGG